MDQKLKRKWVRALRSGQYKQGDMALCSRDGKRFCCLGVLADVQGATWEEAGRHGIGGLAPIIKGIEPSGDAQMLRPREAGGLRTDTLKKLAEMNDEGDSFRVIADYIEARL